MLRNTDRFLIAIVIGILLLVVGAFAVVLSRPEPSYQAEDTPDGVAYNYLLALYQEDYQRAYGYLSKTLPALPESGVVLRQHVRRWNWEFTLDSQITFSIVNSQVQGDNAVVTIQLAEFHQGGLFDSSQMASTFEMDLALEDSAWKITSANRFFLWCWKNTDGCKP